MDWIFNEGTEEKSAAVFKPEIGSNSGLRCWFRSVLYFLTMDDQFMTILEKNKQENAGCTLLHRILFYMKLSVIERNQSSLNVITYFIEALLQV